MIVKSSFKDLTSSKRTVRRQEEFYCTKRPDYAEFEIVSNFLDSIVETRDSPFLCSNYYCFLRQFNASYDCTLLFDS